MEFGVQAGTRARLHILISSLAGEGSKLGSRNRSFGHSRPAFQDHRARLRFKTLQGRHLGGLPVTLGSESHSSRF